MATGFDFEEFYVDEKLRTEAAIDRSGVNVQNPTEQAEAVTNNVVYYVSAVEAVRADGTVAPLSADQRVLVESLTSDGSVAGEQYYVRPWHPLGEVAFTGIDPEWEPGKERESAFRAQPSASYRYLLIDDSLSIPGPVAVTSFTATVYPRYETEFNRLAMQQNQISGGTPVYPVDQGVVTDPRAMKLLYGALGLYGGRWKGTRWLENVWDKGGMASKYIKDRAVMGYDRFRRGLDYLAEVCRDADVGFSVNYYDQSYAKEVTVDDATREDYRKNPAAAAEKHRRYREAVEAADVTRTGMSSTTSFEDAYNKYLPEFMAKGFLSTPAVGTALVPPAKTAVKAFFYQAEELEEDFASLFKSVMDSISAVPFVWRFVSGSTKRKLAAAKSRYLSMESGSGYMAFDVEQVLRVLLAGCAGVALPRMIRVSGNSGIFVYTPGTTYEQRGDAMYASANPDTVYRENLREPDAPYANVNNSYSGASVAWNKNVRMVDGSEMERTVVDIYNTAVALGIFVADKVADYESGMGVQAFASFAGLISNFMNLMCAVGAQDSSGNVDAGLVEAFVDRPYDYMANYDAWARQYGLAGNEGFSGRKYPVLCWEETVTPGQDAYPDPVPAPVACFPETWKDISTMPTETYGSAVRVVELMKDAYGQMKTAATAMAFTIGAGAAAAALYSLDSISDDLAELDEVCRKLVWYQRLVEESPFTNRSLIPGDGWNPTCTSSLPAHLVFPVSMYKKVRVRRKILGRTRHRTVKRSIGVRWAEVTFYDASVYAEYPTVPTLPGETFPFSGGYSVDGNRIDTEEPLPDAAVEAGRAELVFSLKGSACRVSVEVENEYTMTVQDTLPVGNPPIVSVKVPLKPSQPDGSKERVSILYSMPGLPYDSEIRKKAFAEYGPLSQSRFFEPVRNTGVDPDRKEGWKVFRPSSDSLADLRDGMGLHDKVAMLVSVLKHEFGDSRVSLAETWRSMEDQAKMCTGGPESEFLSWHNYGLAARVLILKEDGKTPMEKDDPDMKRLISVARAFTECCENGRFGAPCNVVWCARLAVGPSIFDWEFLPVGVGHKDAPAFRDMTIAQKDPVRELGYVDVDAAGYVRKKPPEDGSPYVLADSPALRSAETRGGHRFVSPDRIRNFPHVEDIVLYDAKEFADMVKLKMSANGTSLPESGSIYDWKAMNPVSCEQLVRYYAMTGNVAAAKAILAGDYVERYLPVEEQFFNTSPVDYVKGMLGSHYATARVCTARDGDSSYITLSDGILHVRQLDAYPDNPPTRLDMHKQQRVDTEHVRRGVWKDGIFYTADELEGGIPYVDSDAPVIDGYVDGEAVSGEAVLLHQVVATRIHKRFGEIRKMFEEFGGALMYDRVSDGPNAGMADMLENEFGLIGAQDLLSFDDLELMADGILDNDTGRDKVLVDGSIYEKVVNNAQLAGIRKASLDKEHIHVRDMPTPSDGKTLYELLAKGRGYTANDLI